MFIGSTVQAKYCAQGLKIAVKANKSLILKHLAHPRGVHTACWVFLALKALMCVQ